MDSTEGDWMNRWEVNRLFNIDVPTFGSSKRSLLTSRKVWFAEIARARGSMLAMTKLPVSTLFARQHHVHVPYRGPLQVPFLTPGLKRELRDAVYEAIQWLDVWLVYVRNYVQARLHLVCVKTNTVGRLLMCHDLRRSPIDFLEVPPASPCPCARWFGLPGVGAIYVHAMFRDPEVLRSVAPGCHVDVYQQNLKDATVPSFTGFKETLARNMSCLKSTLANHHRQVSSCLVQALEGVVGKFYSSLARTFPKQLYALVLKAARAQLPAELVFGVFDRGRK